MALGFPKPIKKTDPRLSGQETDYSSSRGGWVKKPTPPLPGAKKPKK
ncbi:hypothetical protein KVH27_18560 [Streptomyces olivaceus]|nr:hypothetical protein [Streptomyces olivaceus]MBZ6250374.1 hypothetical protein [Streptomyces olivaceus]